MAEVIKTFIYVLVGLVAIGTVGVVLAHILEEAIESIFLIISTMFWFAVLVLAAMMLYKMFRARNIYSVEHRRR